MNAISFDILLELLHATRDPHSTQEAGIRNLIGLKLHDSPSMASSAATQRESKVSIAATDRIESIS